MPTNVRQLLEYTRRFCLTAHAHSQRMRGAKRARIHRLTSYLQGRSDALLEAVRDCEDDLWEGARQGWPAPLSSQALGRLVHTIERSSRADAEAIIRSGLHLDDYLQLACETLARRNLGTASKAPLSLTLQAASERADLMRELFPDPNGTGRPAAAKRPGAAPRRLH